MGMMRLQKFLSAAGVCSRRRGEAYIQQGLVCVNGQIVTTLGTSVDPQTDRVTFKNRPVHLTSELIYVALHKPAGYVTSCRRQNAPIVLDLLSIPHRVYPIGRLDKDSEGLLLLTDDGALQARISSPKFKQPKTYWAQVEGEIDEDALARLRAGVQIKSGLTRPAEARRIDPPANLWPRDPPIRERKSIPTSWVEVVLREGKNRQVRRMTASVGFPTLRLIRSAIGPWSLGMLAPGEHSIDPAGGVRP